MYLDILYICALGIYSIWWRGHFYIMSLSPSSTSDRPLLSLILSAPFSHGIIASKGRPHIQRQQNLAPAFFHAKKRSQLAFFQGDTCVFPLGLTLVFPQVAAFSDFTSSGPLQAPPAAPYFLSVLLLSYWIRRLLIFSALDRLVRLRFQQRPLSSFIPPLIAYTRWAFTSSSSLASSTVACCFFWTAVVSTHTR